MTESDEVALVRRVNVLFNGLPEDPEDRRASPEVRELLALFAEDVVFHSHEQIDAQGTVGRRSFSEGWEKWFEMWKSQRSEIKEIEQRGNRVLLHSREHFVGRDDLEVEWDASSVYTVENGVVTILDVYGTDHEAARSAFEAGTTG